MPAAKPKQFPSGFLVAALLAASGLMWAVMFFGPLEHLTDLAGGLTPFDIRPKGYSYAEAHALLEALGEQGRAFYANPELVIDTFYPPLCGLAWAGVVVADDARACGLALGGNARANLTWIGKDHIRSVAHHASRD